ncbi:universal stress protein [Phreatobacter sp.]|uniref:universal stress protein n=1 Tax=Phreatobacter sp. TaxID=1966341 RepID=UPI0025F60206|nr:universal stress protein [Phreatobacter sp.]
MTRKREAYQSGHTPKFMVVIDDSQECDRAIVFAARRASRTGHRLQMLAVVEPRIGDGQALFGVADVMRAEAHADARAKLDAAADRAMKLVGVEPELVVREGTLAEAILAQIEDDPDISILVLAASAGKDGPGPLVSSLARTAGSYPIPVAIVPGQLSDDEIAALA